VGAGSSNLRLKVSCTLFDTLSLNCKGNGKEGMRPTVFTTPCSLFYSQHCIPPHPRPSSTAYLIKEALGHVLGDHCRLLSLTELSLVEGMSIRISHSRSYQSYGPVSFPVYSHHPQSQFLSLYRPPSFFSHLVLERFVQYLKPPNDLIPGRVL